MLIEGKWSTVGYKPDAKGRFVRQKTVFREWVTDDGSSPFSAEAGRYRLYVANACPWAHRTLIARKLLGLEDVIDVAVVAAKMPADGWYFTDEEDGAVPDPDGARLLRDVYLRADAKFTGRVTVPVLWDTKTGTIVNNESREIVRMLNTVFLPLAEHPKRTTYIVELHDAIEAEIDAIYNPVNNGVYRAGFARTQEAYEEAVSELFAELDRLNETLAVSRFLCGDTLTEADIFLFTTLIRFDHVYYHHFKCSRRAISDYPHLARLRAEVYRLPGVAETVNLEHIVTHYYWSHESINPKRIVPLLPSLEELFGETAP